MVLSVVLHSLAGLVYLWSKDVAFSLVMLYSVVWHIPTLYANLWTVKDYRPLALALGASVAGVAAAGTEAVRSTVPFFRTGQLHFSHVTQRIVICHIVVHELGNQQMTLPSTVAAVQTAVRSGATRVMAEFDGTRSALLRWRQRRHLAFSLDPLAAPAVPACGRSHYPSTAPPRLRMSC